MSPNERHLHHDLPLLRWPLAAHDPDFGRHEAGEGGQWQRGLGVGGALNFERNPFSLRRRSRLPGDDVPVFPERSPDVLPVRCVRVWDVEQREVREAGRPERELSRCPIVCPQCVLEVVLHGCVQLLQLGRVHDVDEDGAEEVITCFERLE